LGLSDLLTGHRTLNFIARLGSRIMTASGSQVESHVGLDIVLGNAFYHGVHVAENGLYDDVSLLGRFSKPAGSFRRVLNNTLT